MGVVRHEKRGSHRNTRRFTLRDRDNTPREGKRPHSHGAMFAAGQVVTQSGIYEVLHDNDHRPSHEVVMVAKDSFPACEVCEERVRYRVLRTAPYIFSDEDFEEE